MDVFLERIGYVGLIMLVMSLSSLTVGLLSVLVGFGVYRPECIERKWAVQLATYGFALAAACAIQPVYILIRLL
jgi:hypothetical protein